MIPVCTWCDLDLLESNAHTPGYCSRSCRQQHADQLTARSALARARRRDLILGRAERRSA